MWNAADDRGVPARSLCLLVAVAAIVGPASAALPSKSGIQPQVLSLPTGPGAIEGLGESFEPILNAGTGRYALGIQVPPGRAGFQPDLQLIYDGGDGNGVIGLGWRLGGMQIRRQTDKGLPNYDASAVQADTFITESGEELVRVGGTPQASIQTFRLKNEGAFSRYIYRKDEDRWEVTSRSGLLYSLGARIDQADVSARVVQPGNGATYAWHVAEARDLNGNRVLYSYATDQQQVYCTQIEYGFTGTVGGTSHKIDFTYDSAVRPDSVVDYRPAFRLVTAWRLARIDVRSSGSLVRRYQLDYAVGRTVSLLSRVTLIGSDGSAALPPSNFTYSTPQLAPSASPAALSGLGGASLLLEDQNPDSNLSRAEILDFNGDGLPDLYQSKDSGSPPGEYDVVYVNTGDGSFVRTSLDQSASLGLPIQSSNSFVKDIDGDGLGDLVAQKGGNPEDFVFRRNQGGAWAAADTPFALPAGTTVEQVFTGPDVRSVDLNSDKRIDTLRSYTSTGTTGQGTFFAAYLNKGDGSFDYIAKTTLDRIPGVPGTFSGMDGRLVLADMNGDRLQDLVQLKDASGFGVRYWPAMGNGRFDDSAGNGYLVPFTAGPDLGGIIAKIRRLELGDLNGDGLADLWYVDGTRVRYWLNDGGVQFGAEAQVNMGLSFDPAVATYRLLDLDGDGLQELLLYAASAPTPSYIPAGFSYARLFRDRSGESTDGADNDGDGRVDEADEGSGAPNLLASVTNGIGRTVSLGYVSSVKFMRSATTAWSTVSPFPVPVLARLDIDDGVQSSRTEYLYRDAYYDGAEKEFRGFSSVVQRDRGDAGGASASIPDLITTLSFDVGRNLEALKGKLVTAKKQDSTGAVFLEEVNAWATRPLLTGVGGDTRQVTYPFNGATLTTVVERGAASPVQLRRDYFYDDDYGNLTRQLESGRLDAGWDDERLTVSSYTAGYPTGQQAWILDRLVTQTISDENGAVAAATRIFYDQNATAGQVSQGNLTRVERLVGGGAWQVSTRNDFDAYGNIVATYDGMFGSAAGHSRQFSYDPVFHTYPVQESIATGSTTLSMSASYDPGFGVMTLSTDFNNNITTYGYDAFGRLTAITRPGDSSATTAYDYVLNASIGSGRTINWVETRQRESAGGGTVDSRSFFDGLSRKVMTRSEGESAGQTVVSDTVQFNARQVPRRKYLPYFEGGGLAYVAPSFSGSFTEHTYDALGREIRMTQPDGTIATTEYRPLTRIVRDEEQTNPASTHAGGSMQYVTDGLLDTDGAGRLREVYEPAGWKTSYRYDVLDNLTGYTDAQNNQKFISFDGLSRKTFMNDPDRGQWSYAYDNADNLIQTTDAKGQVIRYQYDGANRILSEFYGPTGSPADVEYHYDSPAGPVSRGDYWLADGPQAIAQAVLTGQNVDVAFDRNGDGVIDAADVVKAARTTTSPTVQAGNTLGHLAWVKDQSGEEHTSYDARGRVVWTVKRIKDDAEDLKNFYTGMDYDSMDRVTQLTYPDQTTLAHQYNGRGLPEAMPGVVSQLDYNPAGERLTLALANGVTTSYSYDSRLRLSRLHSVRASDSLALQDFAYSYDGVSNITRITDQRSNQVLDTIGTELGIASAEARKFNGTQDFAYDSVYRLTQAKNDTVWGTLDWQYDAIGNMVRQDAALLTPDPLMQLGVIGHGGGAGAVGRIGRSSGAPPGPHAVTGTGNPPLASIGYDGNGNVTAEDGATLSWDSKDRLIGYDKGSDQSQYSYDYGDARTSKRAAGTIRVLYINQYVDVRDGGLVKYTYSGANRSARSAIRSPNLNPDQFFLHDYVGSTNLVLAATGAIYEQLVTYPFGSSRLKRTLASQSLADYQFTGKERDIESGLSYFGARYYGSSLSRFISVDPVDIKQDRLSGPQRLNPYSYVLNGPLNKIDPTGKDTEVQLQYYILGNAPIQGDFGHQYLLMRDTNTGETVISRAGPSEQYRPGGSVPVNAISDSAEKSATGRGEITIKTSMTPASQSVDAGQNSKGVPGSTITLKANIGEAKATLQKFNNAFDSANIDYRPRSTNSNAYAGTAYSVLTGKSAPSMDVLPGSNVNLETRIPGYDVCYPVPASTGSANTEVAAPR